MRGGARRCPEIGQLHESLPIIDTHHRVSHIPCLHPILAPVIWAQFPGQLAGRFNSE